MRKPLDEQMVVIIRLIFFGLSSLPCIPCCCIASEKGVMIPKGQIIEGYVRPLVRYGILKRSALQRGFFLKVGENRLEHRKEKSPHNALTYGSKCAHLRLKNGINKRYFFKHCRKVKYLPGSFASNSFVFCLLKNGKRGSRR